MRFSGDARRLLLDFGCVNLGANEKVLQGPRLHVSQSGAAADLH